MHDGHKMDSHILKEFGKRIRCLREARGLTQESLADITGFDRTYISMIERGLRNPSLKNIVRLAGGLGSSIEAVVRGIEVKQGDRS